jgi:hypothetical protein
VTVGWTASELRAAALVLEQSAELAGTLDELRLRLTEALERGDLEALRRLLAGPLLVAARGTLDRIAGPSPEGCAP